MAAPSSGHKHTRWAARWSTSSPMARTCNTTCTLTRCSQSAASGPLHFVFTSQRRAETSMARRHRLLPTGRTIPPSQSTAPSRTATTARRGIDAGVQGLIRRDADAIRDALAAFDFSATDSVPPGWSLVIATRADFIIADCAATHDARVFVSIHAREQATRATSSAMVSAVSVRVRVAPISVSRKNVRSILWGGSKCRVINLFSRSPIARSTCAFAISIQILVARGAVNADAPSNSAGAKPCAWAKKAPSLTGLCQFPAPWQFCSHGESAKIRERRIGVGARRRRREGLFRVLPASLLARMTAQFP